MARQVRCRRLAAMARQVILVFMSYERLFVLVCICVFTLSATALSIMLACAWPWLQRAAARYDPRSRARFLLVLRVSPSLTGLVSSAGFAVAFARYEPRHTAEQTGVVLMLTALVAVVFALAVAWRISRSSWNTARAHRLTRRLGQRLHVPDFPLPAFRVAVDFPLAAVSGVWKPRLIVSSRIIDECPPHELSLVLRHEAAHARHRDNLARVCLLGCPDVLSVLPTGAQILCEWHQAVEEAADEDATGSQAAERVSLAAALVRVGRMSSEPRPSWMPALALYDGHPLEHRVRRLLTNDVDQRRPHRRAVMRMAGAAMIAAALWIATGPRLLHVVMEWGVRNLP